MTPNPQDSAVALEVELLPCPFCGSAPDHIHVYFGEEIVRCSNEACPASPMSGGETEAEVFAAWNTRASQSDGTSGGWHTCEESSECAACDLQSPVGWRLVPVTPTKEMIEAAMHVKRVRLLEAVAQIRAGMDETEARTPAIVGEWEAMLAAAPKKSQGENHVG